MISVVRGGVVRGGVFAGDFLSVGRWIGAWRRARIEERDAVYPPHEGERK